MGGGNCLISNELQSKNSSEIDKVDIFDDLQSARTVLSNGVKYAVLAFDCDTGVLESSVINTAGTTPEFLKLDIGEKYDIVVYSFNSSEEPPIVHSIYDEFPYHFTDSTKEFLYYEISNYTPVNGGNELVDVVLKHKFSYAKFILDTSSLNTYNDKGSSIIGTPKLWNVHCESGYVYVSDGSLECGASDLNIPMKHINKNIYESEYVPIMLDSRGVQGRFITEIVAHSEYGDEKKIKNISVEIQPGTRRTYRMKVKGKSEIRCTDPDADNYEEVGRCEFTGECTDTDAINTGNPLPCKYPPGRCWNRDAFNYGEVGECVFIGKCTDPWAINMGDTFRCIYPWSRPKIRITPFRKRGTLKSCDWQANSWCYKDNTTVVDKHKTRIKVYNYNKDIHRVVTIAYSRDRKGWLWYEIPFTNLKFKKTSKDENFVASWVWSADQVYHAFSEKYHELAPVSGEEYDVDLRVYVCKRGEVVDNRYPEDVDITYDSADYYDYVRTGLPNCGARMTEDEEVTTFTLVAKEPKGKRYKPEND